ncbi:PepSY domain-containing protein [Citricoccus sp.]|uniref:PepSY-associated TM helix domain-containing protein n=1 Tax=Citricoccus sp. TaxID=1978372 RepID=UPI0028BD63AD|nr:PepSY domain-containing protein [Citricoccus sp.]
MTTHQTLHTHPGSPPPARSADPPRPPQKWFGALLLRLHFYAGILVGPFILIAATSGALYALSPQLEQAVYADVLRAPPTADPLSLGEQVGIAQERIGEEATLTAVRPAPDPGDTTRVMFDQDGLGDSESRAVFIDPGTGQVLGDMTVYGTSGALPLRTWIDQLHRSLHLGDAGRFYSELAASWLWIVALAGLGLWIVRLRRARVKKDLLRPRRGLAGRRRLSGWHASLGIWIVLGALFLSATGITWSQLAGTNVTNLRTALNWGTPTVSTSLENPAGTVDEHAHHHGDAASAPGGPEPASTDPAIFDAVLATSQQVNVNTGLVEIRPPADEGTAWLVQEIQRSFPTEVDAVAIDGATLEATDRVDFAEFSLPAKLARWGIDLHMGSMFGLANQIALFFLAAGIATMVVLGYLMWWKRRPTRESRSPVGTPPRRGVLGRAPWWGLAALATGAILIALALPLVGWTLLGFLVLDTLIGLSRQRRVPSP